MDKDRFSERMLRHLFEGIKVLRNARMSEYTTLKLGGPADWLAFPANRDEIVRLISEAKQADLPVTVIGHGSDLLVLDGGIRGLVIRIGKEMSRVRVEGKTVRAQAGAMLGTVAAAAAEAGLTGLEFASGIPGTVGGGIFMNAGAYGGEMAQVVTCVEGIRPDGTPFSFAGSEMHFGYRASRVAEEALIVTDVTMTLREGNRDEIRAQMQELNRRRNEKQPLNLPSAGSTFKRPEGYFAGALIEQCGLKGYTIGGAQVSEKHAGFLVNLGTSAKEFMDLIRYVQKTVLDQTGVKLETEVRIIGEEET